MKDQYQAALAQAENENFVEAFALWLPLAQAGHVESQLRVGLMLSSGIGVEQDQDAGVEWLEKAAESGNEDARQALEIFNTMEEIHIERHLNSRFS